MAEAHCLSKKYYQLQKCDIFDKKRNMSMIIILVLFVILYSKLKHIML